MPGQQDFVHIFNVPEEESSKQKLMGWLDEVDARIKSMQGISLMGKNVNSSAEFRQSSQQMIEALEKIAALEKDLQALREEGARKNKPKADENLRTLVQERQERQKNIQSIKDELKMNEAAEGSLNQKRLQLKALQQAYDALSASQKKSSEGQAVLGLLKTKDKEVKGDEFESGRFGRNVGNYTGALHTLEAALTEAREKLTQLTQAGQANTAQGEKLQQEVATLNGLVGQQAKGFTSLTMEVRAGERALQSLRASGMEGTESFEKLRMEVAGAAREMHEFQKGQQLLESGAPVLKSLTVAAKGLGGAYAIGAGAAAILADGDEKVEKELNKLVAVMTVLQGLNEVHELLEKKGAIATIFSAAVLKVKNFVMNGSTDGIKKNTIGTEENTIAQEANAAAVTTTSRAMVGLRFALMATGIGVLLLLLPLFVEGMTKVAKAAKDAKVEEEALEEVNTKMIESYAKERTEVDLVIAQLKDEKISRQEKTKLIDELQEKYPDYLSNIKNEGKYTTELSEAIENKLIPALELEAKAKAAQDLAGEKYKEMLELQNKKVAETGNVFQKALIYFGNFNGNMAVANAGMESAFNSRNAKVKELQESIDALFKISLKAEEGLSHLGKGSHSDGAKQDFTDYEEGFRQLREEFEKFHREAFGLNVEPYIKQLQELLGKYQDGYIKINDVRDKDLAKVKENEQKGIITASQAADLRTKIQKDAADARLDAESAYYANLNGLQDKHRSELVAKQKERSDKDFKDAVSEQDKIAKALGDRADAHFREQVTVAKNNQQANPSFKNDKALAAAERDQKLREQAKLFQEQKITQDEFDSGNAAAQNDYSKKVGEAYVKQFDKYAEYAKKAMGTVDGLEKATAERKINAIQRQIDMNNRLKETEVKNIEASTMSATQKAATLMTLEAKTAANNEALQRKQRDQKIKEAQFDKASAVMQIILNTAKAITGDLAFPWKIAIDAAIGAAELATALAQPVPHYEVGTDFHPGGPMVVHPGELRVDPDGSISKTPDKATLTMGARGTKIIPADEVNRMLFNSIMVNTAHMIERESHVEKKLDELKDVIQVASQAQVNAFRRQKAPVVNIYNDGVFQAHIDKAVRN